MGASAFGFRALWINRAGLPDEYTDHALKQTLASLDTLASTPLVSRGPSVSRRERRQNARPRACAFVEAAQIVFLFRRVNTVIIEPEAEKKTIESENAIEIADDWNGCAGSNGDSLAAPLFRQGGACLAQSRVVIRELNGGRAGMIDELGAAIGRQSGADKGTERLADLVRVLITDQAERDLSRGLCRDDRLGAFSRIASNDAVHVARRPGR